MGLLGCFANKFATGVKLRAVPARVKSLTGSDVNQSLMGRVIGYSAG